MMTADLQTAEDMFEQDKRLRLKPVLDFNRMLNRAFGEGPCACLRCKQSHGNETGYEHQHSFDIDGNTVNRRFAQTTDSDVFQALKKAWLAYYKEEIDVAHPLEHSQIEVFVEPSLVNRFRTLVLACGLAKEVDNKLKLQAVTE